ncbi:MAG TPA: hydroxymethylbilane synthase [Candidatus Babeliales bacterium]|nr:hydroxymethylbilane synthase [Candidatus Babeliales bacterium]
MLPISLRPNGRRAVIVGGGAVAARKAESLVAAGFPIFVVAKRIGERLRSVVEAAGGAYAEREYEPSDLAAAAVVIASTDDDALNARIVADARAAYALACDASHPERGDFTMAAVRRIGELTISVDSNGKSPAFSRRVARELARFGAPYADAMGTLARMRSYVKETFPPHERAPILRALAERPVAELTAAPAKLVCATRRSALAMVQSRSVAAALAQRGIETNFLQITTTGDRARSGPIEALGTNNVFVKELESALREGRADYAVHSSKDLPSMLAADMRIAAVSRREDARDAFCSERYASFESLPAGARVGTSSPRRRAQLAALRPDLRYETLRGNVDTRLRKLARGQYDAIVLAMAGLNRLGTGAAYVVPFAIEQLVPAAGQGALAIETRSGDDRFLNALRDAVNDPQAEACVGAERAALAAMRAGCSAPIGVHAHFIAETLVIEGAFAAAPGALARARVEGRCVTLAQAELLGADLAERLKARSEPSGAVN